jgi:hypothetical protein
LWYSWEVKNWDHTTSPNVKEGQRHVPDIIYTDPRSKTVYIIDVHIAWNISTSGGGDGEYYTGKLAKVAEDYKRSDGAGWGHSVKHHQDFKDGAQFVPFGVEILGELLGSVAQRFFDGARCAVDPGDPRHLPLRVDGTVVSTLDTALGRLSREQSGEGRHDGGAPGMGEHFRGSGIASMAPPQ